MLLHLELFVLIGSRRQLRLIVVYHGIYFDQNEVTMLNINKKI